MNDQIFYAEGKTQFSASFDEIEEYRISASKLRMPMSNRFPAEVNIVEYPNWPDALYLVVTQEEAARIQQEGLYLVGMKEGVRDDRSHYSCGSDSGNSLPQRIVFTTERMSRSGISPGCVRIKVSLRRFKKGMYGDPCVIRWLRLIQFSGGGIIFVDPLRIRSEYCFLLDPICLPFRVTGDGFERDRKLFRARNIKKDGGVKIWDNICHLVISNDVRMLDDVSFSDCENLETVRITDTVEYLGCDSFSRCPKLREVTIESAASNRANRVFCNNPRLSRVYINDSLKTEFQEEILRGDYYFGYSSWFRNCPELRSICFSDGTSMPFSSPVIHIP